MNIRPTGAELLHGAWAGGGWTDRQTRGCYQSIFAILRTNLKKKPTKCSLPFYESHGKILFVFARHNFVTNDISSLATPE
jgi:hypothetical protein